MKILKSIPWVIAFALLGWVSLDAYMSVSAVSSFETCKVPFKCEKLTVEPTESSNEFIQPASHDSGEIQPAAHSGGDLIQPAGGNR